MSEARTFKIRSTLSRQLQAPGGRKVRDLEREATEALESHRDEAMATVAETLTALDALCAEASPETGPRVYALASSIVDVAGYFDTGPLFDAAYSLCEVSDRMIQAQAWRWPPVRVHVQALRLILANDCRAGRTSETLLDGLRSISNKAIR